MLSHVYGFFFNNLLLVLLSAVRAESTLARVTVACVSTLFEERLLCATMGPALSDDEIRRTIKVCIDTIRFLFFASYLVRVLADIIEQFPAFLVLNSPLSYVIVRFPILKAP